MPLVSSIEIVSCVERKEAELDPEYPRFDHALGDTWVYPSNFPRRQYQYDVVQRSLFKNTLVSLPTGLGKTFIAAVVMYNFYRWFPDGKVWFGI